MDQLRRLLEDIKESLQRKCKDHSIVAQLAAMAKETALEDTNFDEYARIAVQLYDISNDSSLVTEDTLGKYSFDSQSMKMKVIVFQMLIGVMHYV